MKNSKKTSGILGTSMGSMLIIVALLTMVGIGSQDTYAGTSLTGEKCTCPDEYTQSGAKCIKQTTTKYTCYTGETSMSPTCSSTSGCTMTGKSSLTAVAVWYKYSCPKVTTDSKACECSGGGTANSSGMCEEKEPSGTTKDDDKPNKPATPSCVIGSSCTTSSGQPGKCISSGSNYGGTICEPNSPAGGDDDDKPNKPTKPSGGDDDSGKNIGNCPAGTYYLGLNHAADCPSGYYCPGGTYNANTGDIISGCEKIACPANATCTSSSYTCNKGYHPSSGGCVKDGTSGGDDGSGGNGGGGNSGGNSGGNGNGGNAGGNNGNNNGGNNTTKNPNTATKAPLVIAIIGIISVGISSVVYFKGKKEINTEI